MTGRPRVLHVQTDTGLSGGVAGYVSTLASAGALMEFDQAVVCPGASAEPQSAARLYGTAPLIVLPPTYGGLDLPAYVRQLASAVHAHRIDVLHAHALRAATATAFVAQRTGKAFVYTNHGLRYSQKSSWAAQSIFMGLEWWACRHANSVVCIRPTDAARLGRSGLMRTTVIQVVTTRIRRPMPLSMPHERPTRPLLLGIGSLIEVKRADRFVQWISALRKTGLAFDATWIGDGPLRGPLEALAKDMDARIRWAGHLDRQAVDDQLADADLLLLTSQFEVFPLAVLEAFSRGVPVVSGSFDGLEDFLTPGYTGLVVPPDDAAVAAAAIAALLSDTPRWRAMSVAARERFECNFVDPERMAASYAGLYRDALGLPLSQS